MAGNLKAIRRRLVSVKNTRQITRAMKLVSAAKLNRAQIAVVNARAYSSALERMFAKLLKAQSGAEFSHALMQTRPEVKNIRIIILGGSRGLCGGYNTNINKQVEATLKTEQANFPGAQVEFVIVGKKPGEYFRRVNRNYLQLHEKVSEDPNKWPIEEVCSEAEIAFAKGEVDRVVLIYTAFLSVMSNRATATQLLPFSADAHEGSSTQEESEAGLTIFEPSVAQVFDSLVPRLMRVKVRQAALESKVSEHASRMTAMDSATKNAGELIDKLTLYSNRLRQSGITGELLDIVGGAEALND